MANEAIATRRRHCHVISVSRDVSLTTSVCRIQSITPLAAQPSRLAWFLVLCHSPDHLKKPVEVIAISAR
jgi:hypothetical protein